MWIFVSTNITIINQLRNFVVHPSKTVSFVSRSYAIMQVSKKIIFEISAFMQENYLSKSLLSLVTSDEKRLKKPTGK